MIVQGVHVGDWVAERIGGFFDPVCMTAIGWDDGERITAGASYRDWNGVSIEGQIAVEKPMVKGFVRAIFHYPFRQIGARKLVVTTTSDNERSLHLLRRFGFREEARLRDAAPGGDLIICTMRREECRFLGESHGKESVRSSRS